MKFLRNFIISFSVIYLHVIPHSARQLKSGQGNLSAFSISNAKTSSVQPRPLALISRGLIVDTRKTYQYLNSRSSSLEGFTMNWRKRSHFFALHWCATHLNTSRQHLEKHMTSLLHQLNIKHGWVSTLAILDWIHKRVGKLFTCTKEIRFDETHHTMIWKHRKVYPHQSVWADTRAFVCILKER